MSEPCCADCHHMMDREREGERFLLCTRYPPKLLATLDGAETAWPAIYADDRCGEFQRRDGDNEVEQLRHQVDTLTDELNEARRQT